MTEKWGQIQGKVSSSKRLSYELPGFCCIYMGLFKVTARSIQAKVVFSLGQFLLDEAGKVRKYSANSSSNVPWVPEAFLARFPVASYVLYYDPREKPLDQSAIALMTPNQWLACLNQFSPEFGSGC